MANNGWTPERRAKQSALIKSWEPWKRSTGPKTPQGKDTSSKNRQRSLEDARQGLVVAMHELQTAQAKLKRLTRG